MDKDKMIRIKAGMKKGDFIAIGHNLNTNKLLVKCTRCNRDSIMESYIFNELDNPRCKECNTIDILVDRVGFVSDSGLAIIEELGENKVIAECVKSKHRDVYNKSALVSNNIKNCKVCKELEARSREANKELKTDKITDTGLKVGDTRGSLTVVYVSDNRDDIIVQCNECNEKEKRKYASFKYGKEPKCKYCSENSNFKNVKGQVFDKLKVIADKGGGVVKAKCNNCGAIGEYNKNRLMTKGSKCILCDKKNSPLYQNQMTKVFNGLMVIGEEVGDDGKTISVVECVDCGSKYNVVKGSLVTLGNACKKCFDKDKNAVCPNCKKALTFRRNRTVCQCDNCKKKFSREIISAPVDFAYRLFKNEQKYGSTGTRVIGSMQLLDYKYKGRDEMLYFDAVCLDHNTKVVASMNEAKIGSHEVCDCEFDM